MNFIILIKKKQKIKKVVKKSILELSRFNPFEELFSIVNVLL